MSEFSAAAGDIHPRDACSRTVGAFRFRTPRRTAVAAMVAAFLTLLAQAAPAGAVTPTSSWGWFVGPYTCTSSCKNGIPNGDAGGLANAGGIAIDGSTGNMYVADTNNNRIDILSSSGGFLEAWGWGVGDGANRFETCTTSCQSGQGGCDETTCAGDPAGEMEKPTSVAIDSTTGNVYVLDSWQNRVDEFNVHHTGICHFVCVSFVSMWGWGVKDGANQFEICTTSCQTGLSGGSCSGAYCNGGGAGEIGANVFCFGAFGCSYTSGDQGIAVDPSTGNVFVADTWDNRIEEFSSSGSFIQTWGFGVADGNSQFEICVNSCQSGVGGGGAGQMSGPQGIAVDTSGNVWVADTGNNRIDEFSPTGGAGGWASFTQAWGADVGGTGINTCTSSCQGGTAGAGTGQLNGPDGLVLDSSGDVYVADTGNNRIDELCCGVFLSDWGTAGGGVGQLNGPQAIALNGSYVWVADSSNNRIDQFDVTGTFYQALGAGVVPGPSVCTTPCWAGYAGTGAGQLDTPYGVAVNGSSGDVYVVDKYSWRVDELSSSGASIRDFGSGGTGAGQFGDVYPTGPLGIAVDSSSGDVYVADTGNNRIDQFSSSGAFIRAWGWGVANGASQFETCVAACKAGISGAYAGQLNSPAGLAVDGSGNVYVADTGNNRIDEFSSSGAFIEAWGWGVADGGALLETCTTTTSCQVGSSGGYAGQLAGPNGVAINITSGNVFVADTSNNRIDEFTPSGGAGGTAGFIQAWGWNVVDNAGKFESCTTTCQSGASGGSAGELSSAFGVAAGSGGNVYVADTGNNRIDEFTPSGSSAGFVQAWGWGVTDGKSRFETCASSCQSGMSGGGAGQLAAPNGVADSSSNVYVADSNNQRIDAFTTGPVTVTAASLTVTYGQADITTTYSTSSSTLCQSGPPNPYCKQRVVNPIVTCTYGAAVVPAIQATGLTTARSGAPAGTYPTSCWGAYDPSYVFSYVPGTLTVNPAPLTIHPNNMSVARGAKLPQLTWKAHFVNHDTAASLSRQPSCRAAIRTNKAGRITSPPGSYAIRCSGARDPNYAIRYARGKIRVVPRRR